MIEIMNAVDLITNNGRCTGLARLVMSSVSAVTSSNYWASQENSSNNAWNVNFGSGAVNNNNKYNGNVVRAVVALDDQVKEEWLAAYEDCCRHKMGSDACIRYRREMEDDIFYLAWQVQGGTYEIGPSDVFWLKVPKLREVFAAAFRDRIVQHWIIMRLNPPIEDGFVSMGNVSYNCRKGYGTLAAVERLGNEILRVSDGYRRRAYVATMDISSFFPSIDKGITWQLLEPLIWREGARIRAMFPGTDIGVLAKVTEQVIMHRPQRNCIIKGDVRLLRRLISDNPKKSQLTNDGDVALPIGNITSQIIANYVLSFLDRVLLDACSVLDASVVRFVDDIAVVAHDTADIVTLRSLAGRYLRDNLNLRLHHDKFYIQNVKKGCRFVGTWIKPGRCYTSRQTISHFADRMKRTDELCAGILTQGCTYERLKKLKGCIISLNSYNGFLCHTASRNRRISVISKADSFYRVCYFRRGGVAAIRKKYQLSQYLSEYEDNITAEA